ncbi:MAG: Uma2 family endonuclease [Gammaproteobacteria bacterium]|nr:Uma2 family endonuclease [Gammaproteobacteria bacterium]
MHSEVRHELVDGQVYAMVGASNIHNLLAGALYFMLRGHLKKPCQVYISDMKVRASDGAYYPDVAVSCTPAPNPFYGGITSQTQDTA